MIYLNNRKKKKKKIRVPLNEIKMLRYVENDCLNNLNFSSRFIF